jgi:hypothetical protein
MSPDAQVRRTLGWGWALGGGVAAMAALLGAAILYMVLYSYAIRPGGTEDFYRDYAKKASPVVCTAAGIPVFFLISWWIGRRRSVRPVPTAFLTWAIFILLDQGMALAMGERGGDGSLLGWISYASKLTAALAGGAIAGRVAQAASGAAPTVPPSSADAKASGSSRVRP